MAKNFYTIYHDGTYKVFPLWAEAKEFLDSCDGFTKCKGFVTKSEAIEFGEQIKMEQRAFTEGHKKPKKQKPTPELDPTPKSPDMGLKSTLESKSIQNNEEIRRLFKLIATELRENGVSKPKILALVFDKLSTEFF